MNVGKNHLPAARPRLFVAVLGLLFLAGCGRLDEGIEAYEAGRYAEALSRFDAAVAAAGDDASPELLYDQALSALRVGRAGEAETAARRAAERGDVRVRGLGDFVRGLAAFLRSEAAEAESKRPGGDRTAREWAVATAEDALSAFRRAAASREDWPAARRNVERALLRLERLRERRTEGRPRPRPDPGAPDAPPPPPDAPPDTTEEPTRIELETAELPAAEVLRLLEVLHEKDREKRDIRRAARQTRTAEVEKDW